jgi:hypothetical protein
MFRLGFPITIVTGRIQRLAGTPRALLIGVKTVKMIFILMSLNSGSALAISPKAPADLNLLQLLNSFQARQTSSTTVDSAASAPYLKFKARAELKLYASMQLGPACVLRSLARDCEQTFSDPYNGILNTVPGDVIQKDDQYRFIRMTSTEGYLSAVFKNANNPVCKIEISCSHPDLQSWTVEEFENQASNNFEVHTNLPKELSIAPMIPSLGEMKIKELKGSFANGLFGSGLPGKSGMQLHLGANLNAFADPKDAPLFKGKKCFLVSQATDSIGQKYLKGAKFGFSGFSSKPDVHAVDLIFNNLNYSPHQIRIRCFGAETEIQEMTVASLEQDLNHTMSIYQK